MYNLDSCHWSSAPSKIRRPRQTSSRVPFDCPQKVDDVTVKPTSKTMRPYDATITSQAHRAAAIAMGRARDHYAARLRSHYAQPEQPRHFARVG